jgi:hypothetical protein
MKIELIAVLSILAPSAVWAAVTIERRMDVLYGPYIEGRAGGETALQQLAALTSSLVDDLRWRARNVMYVTSLVAA